MRKFIFLLPLIFLLFISCGRTPSEDEPFSADFTYKDRSFEPTSIVFDSNYTGETHVLSSDAVDFSDISEFCKNALFGSGNSTLSMLSRDVTFAVTGDFTREDADFISECIASLNGISSFPNIEEASLSEADVIISFSDTNGFVCHKDSYGRIVGADISVSSNGDFSERQHLIAVYLFNLCGFSGSFDTNLDSLLSANPSKFFSDTDLLITEALYSVGTADMTQSEFLTALENYFFSKNNQSEVLS